MRARVSVEAAAAICALIGARVECVTAEMPSDQSKQACFEVAAANLPNPSKTVESSFSFFFCGLFALTRLCSSLPRESPGQRMDKKAAQPHAVYRLAPPSRRPMRLSSSAARREGVTLAQSDSAFSFDHSCGSGAA